VNTFLGHLAATSLNPIFCLDNFKYIKSFWIFQISGEKNIEMRKGMDVKQGRILKV
jgi:mRNA-degrading endonuclease HigB of HigAB toxin-antitoxin module